MKNKPPIIWYVHSEENIERQLEGGGPAVGDGVGKGATLMFLLSEWRTTALFGEPGRMRVSWPWDGAALPVSNVLESGGYGVQRFPGMMYPRLEGLGLN